MHETHERPTPARAPSQDVRTIGWTIVAMVLAPAALGVFADLGHLLPVIGRDLPQLGAPWLALSFFAGRLRRSWFGACVSGAFVIGLGLFSYFIFKRLAYGPNSVGVLAANWQLWVVVGALLGPAIGLAGYFTKSKSRANRGTGWGLVAGVLVAEAISAHWIRGSLGWGIFGAELLAAALCVSWGARRASLQRVATVTVLCAGVNVLGAFVSAPLFRAAEAGSGNWPYF